MDKDSEKDKTSSILVFISIISTIIGLLILIIFLNKLSNEYSINGEGSILLDKTAQVGDFVGGVIGSIWALTGVLLFYSALRLQRKEFKLQRKELELTRKEMKRTADNQELVSKNMFLQFKLTSLSAQISTLVSLMENEDRSKESVINIADRLTNGNFGPSTPTGQSLNEVLPDIAKRKTALKTKLDDLLKEVEITESELKNINNLK